MKEKLALSERILFVLLALMGMLIMGYLISIYFSSGGITLCNFGESFSCDKVNTSPYSELLGIPVSVFGFIYFLIILFVGLFKHNRSALRKALVASIIFLIPALYFTGVELFVLKNICVFCEVSKILVVGILLLSWYIIHPEKVGSKNLKITILIGFILAIIMYIIQFHIG